ncbi:hypothetical protein H7X65_01045 [Candidatus Parcubacteria bacterium]|nr:hypothetical protein [Candidatus Parcubacteria bacterium]
MKMNYQSGDKLKNRYLSNDAFTSLTNKLGGRSIISLGNRRKQNSYRVANQGMNLFDYKSLIYKTFVVLVLLLVCMYVIPQTRYFIHGYVTRKITADVQANAAVLGIAHDVAPVFLKTDEFIAKQKGESVADGMYVYDFFSNYVMGVTMGSSSSTVHVKLFSDAGFKNNFLIEQDAPVVETPVVPVDLGTTTSTTTGTEAPLEVVQEKNQTYQSYVFEGLGYGQLIAKVPPKTVVKKDTYVYIRTVDGLKAFAKIINVDEDNKSTFTIIYAQLIVSPQNIYKVTFK